MKASRIIVFVFVAVAATLPALAQSDGPFVGRPVQADVSPPMYSVGPPPDGGAVKTSIPLKRYPTPRGGPDTAVQDEPGAPANVTSGIGFDGIGVGLGNYDPNVAPPDTTMAVGPNHIVQWVNIHWAIFDKSGNLLPGYPKGGNSLWSGFGGLCETNNNGDPIVQYDRLADRWHMSQFAFSAPFGPWFQCYAISTSPDPNGSYYRYAYSYSALPDYPKVSVWPVPGNGMYLSSYNMFNFGAFFSGARVCAYDRAAMLAGDSSPVEICFQDASVHSLLPIDLDGATPPPVGTPGIFVRFGTDQLQRFKLTPNFANPSSSTFTGPTNIPVAGFSPAPTVSQSETSQTLDSLSDRLMYRLAYTNYLTHDSTVVNHAVEANAGASAAVRWYELRNINADPPSVHQQSTFAPDGLSRWMGSIAMDKNGNIGLGYSVSSSSMHPAIRYTGRLASDPPNTLQAETSMVEGTGSQTEGLGRWGDYSTIRIDPTDDCTFWFTTEYIKSNGTFNWSTRIGSFKHDSCGGPPPAPPLPPTNLVAVAGSAVDRIDLTWQDNSEPPADEEDGFKIERCDGDFTACSLPTATFAQIAQVGNDVTSYTDAGLPLCATRSYRVRAFRGASNSAYSNVDDASTSGTAPAAASALGANAVSASQINLTWSDNSTNESGFRIERCAVSTSCEFAQIAEVGPNTTGYNNTGLSASTTYRYRVLAFNNCGNNGYSTEAEDRTFPAAPSNLTATPGRNGGSASVTLTWNDNSTDEDNFIIERCSGVGCSNFAPLATVSAGTTTYQDNTTARRADYSYRVKARRNPADDSAYSNVATARTR